MNKEVNEIYAAFRLDLIKDNKKCIKLLHKNNIFSFWNGWEYCGFDYDKFYFWDYKIPKKIWNEIPFNSSYPNVVTKYKDFYVISLLVKEDGI